jgi:hypothetical protein
MSLIFPTLIGPCTATLPRSIVQFPTLNQLLQFCTKNMFPIYCLFTYMFEFFQHCKFCDVIYRATVDSHNLCNFICVTYYPPEDSFCKTKHVVE